MHYSAQFPHPHSCSKNMNRRKFITNSSLTAIGMTTLGKVLQKSDGQFEGDCATTNDILGPFYRPDAPLRSDLTYEGIKGSIIQLEGIVYQDDCTTPAHNALVEIWHCSADGEYDNKSKAFKHRASFLTDENGRYSFLTIIPGKYLNGQLYRPSHIHYRVTEKNSRELISQIYFQGDPHITKDPWASKDKAALRILPIIPKDTNGNLAVQFDVYLSKK